MQLKTPCAKDNTKLVTTKDIISGSHVNSHCPVIFIAGRPKAALLFWFFDDFRCGALLFMVIHVIYKYKNK